MKRLFNRENYKLCKGGPQIWKIKRFFDISNGVKKKFLNLNQLQILVQKTRFKEAPYSFRYMSVF